MSRKTSKCFHVAVLLLWCAAACQAQQLRLTGRVANKDTGKPVAGVRVGAIRAGWIQRRASDQGVKPEKVLRTDREGRFELNVQPTLPGVDEVIVFTCGEGYANEIYKGVAFKGSLPNVSDLQKEGVVRLNLTKDAGEITLSVKAVPTAGKMTVMVPMRDGVRLATDIYLPDGEGPWPVILSRTPYGKNRAKGKGLTRQGYVFVMQDFRGRFESEGQNLPFIGCGWGEIRDGYDTIEWIASQPWCNGKVGTAGGSALGITQVLTAGAAPPHLVCQRISVAAGSLYHHAAFWGGVFRKNLVEGWLRGNRFDPESLRLMLSHPDYDSYWRAYDASTRSSVIVVPALFQGGWFDCFSQGTIDAFLWRQNDGGEDARGKQKLLMGPWTHGRKQGELKFPENSRRPPGPIADAVAWFDFWLKGVDNGIARVPAVTYYVMGDTSDPDAPGNEWRTSDVWPVPAEATPFYFREGGRLIRKPPEGAEKPDSFKYDPKDPVPTRGGNNLGLPKGPMDQRPVENRPDVILFTTEELTEPIEVTGRVKVKLWASSSCKDTDFTAKLTDVYPDGRSMLLLDGIIRARHRNSLETEELMTPGEIYQFEVDLWSTSIVFNKGHRIRVAVSSSNAPRFDPNPNTGDPFRANDKTVVAENTIYHDADHPSHILLPVVKRAD